MSQLSAVLRDVEDGVLMFRCPGCGQNHMIYVGDGSGPKWAWNRDAEKPTFTPSVLVKTGHYVTGYNGGGCWCDYNAEEIAQGREHSGFDCVVCHSFVTEGRIRFLDDCTHKLRGQTVDLPRMVD